MTAPETVSQAGFLPGEARGVSGAVAEMGLRRFLILAVVIVVVGSALRFQGLGREAFWFNESASFHYARGTAADVVRHSFSDETNPPGFHLLIHFWQRLAGIEEWALRLPSAAAGSLALAAMAFFARLFLGRVGALAAMAMLALSPLHVWYSQECRAFAIWVLCILAAYTVFLRWERTGARALLAWNTLCVVLAVAFHYFGLHVVLIQNAFLSLAWRRIASPRRRDWLVAQAATALLLMPFAVMMLTVERTNVAWWGESAVRLSALKALAFHLNGVFFFLTPERPIKAALLLANTVAFALGCWSLRRGGRLAFPLLALLLPMGVNLAYSILVSPILGNAQSAGRYFLLTLPPFLVILAAGWEAVLQRFGRWSIWLVALAVYLSFLALGVRASRCNTPFARDNNRRLCRVLFDNARPGDLLIAAPYITVEYYAHRLDYDLSPLRIVGTSRFDERLFERLPDRAERLWLYVDPAHHFDELAQGLAKRYGLTRTVEERERGLSGVALFLLSRKEDAP